MAFFIALSAFLAVAFLAAFVGLAALSVGGGDPVDEDFDHGRAP
jgi:hypothetical protein